MASAGHQSCEGVLHDLARDYAVDDDTDLNCDVCFTYIVRAARPLVCKLSLAGPYAVILACGADDSGAGSLVSPFQAGETADVARVASVLNSHGFMLVPAAHLETPVPLALVPGCEEVTLYAALFEPEGEVPPVA
ncbi:hypothetical protein ABZ639_24280 [Saccharomonospora sp. NPDC006951]